MKTSREAAGNMAQVRIGTSGWYYDHWEGVLYPPKLPKAKRFAAYAERFGAVEVNATFYRLPSPAMVEGWHRQAPPGFAFVNNDAEGHAVRNADTLRRLTEEETRSRKD